MTGELAPSTGPVVGDQRKFSKANLRPLIFCSIAVVGAVLYGYDGTYFSAILEMRKFKEDFGTVIDDMGTIDITSSQRSLLASIVQAGEFCGALASAPIGDFAGRKGGFISAGSLVALGTVLQMVHTGSIPLMTVGRLVLGAGVGVISATTSPYLSEIAPVSLRGPVVSAWQLMLAIGQVIGAGVGLGTRDMDNSWSYRIPIILNLAIVAILMFGIIFVCPESPRWLINKGRDEQARAALRRIHKGQDDPNKVVDLEFSNFYQARQDEIASQGEGGWLTLFKSKHDRRRLAMVIGVLICQQISGIQIVFSYSAVLIASLSPNFDGILVNIIYTIVEVVGVLVAFLLVDRFGRRPLLLWTSVPMVISLLIAAALGSLNDRSDNQNRAIAAMFGIFVFAFNNAWGPLAWVCASELSTGGQKQKIMAVGSACFWISAWAVTFTLPYLFDEGEANLGFRVGYIYCVGGLIAAWYVWTFIPETFGRTLEEIQQMIQNDVPTRKWTSYVTHFEGTTWNNDVARDGTSRNSADKAGSLDVKPDQQATQVLDA
ncbi:general substrate transporter [Ceraceosorus guamensis]|uniref:General substrate transporter n=1 Tax=Ceraceosorus guamensis TaxID=1522189 RepID=A0A316W0N7_9BASI|nr:general substrate transporter [Ceraceosorus guamensis]PWN43259.1 general substrate transporter [Ceraceosorus guamensis]